MTDDFVDAMRALAVARQEAAHQRRERAMQDYPEAAALATANGMTLICCSDSHYVG